MNTFSATERILLGAANGAESRDVKVALDLEPYIADELELMLVKVYVGIKSHRKCLKMREIDHFSKKNT